MLERWPEASAGLSRKEFALVAATVLISVGIGIAYLGAFGMGSTTASLYLGRLQHVITTPEPDLLCSAATDLDVILSEQKFVKHLDFATDEDEDTFRKSFERWGLERPQTGTVVRVERADNLQRERLGPAKNALVKYLGSTYRKLIDAGVTVLVNGEKVVAYDPLERSDPETVVLLEEEFEYTFPKGHKRAGERESIGAVLVQLRDWGGIEANKEKGYTLSRSGFYCLRNRREIVSATTLGLYARHNEFSRFRGELLFPATMDNEVGVSFLKSAWDIKPSQSLRDKLREELTPYLRTSRNMYRKSRSRSADLVSHDGAAKVISQRSPLLRKPATDMEKRRSPQNLDGKPKSTKDCRTRSPKSPRTRRALADLAKFEVEDFGADCAVL